MANPKRGTVFTHKSLQDPDSPISRNSPKAVCRVTAVRKGLVYFTYNDGSVKGSWFTALNAWLSDYGTAE